MAAAAIRRARVDRDPRPRHRGDGREEQAGRQKNRCIEISLLPALEELPPLPPNLTEETSPKDIVPQK